MILSGRARDLDCDRAVVRSARPKRRLGAVGGAMTGGKGGPDALSAGAPCLVFDWIATVRRSDIGQRGGEKVGLSLH